MNIPLHIEFGHTSTPLQRVKKNNNKGYSAIRPISTNNNILKYATIKRFQKVEIESKGDVCDFEIKIVCESF